MYTNLQTTVMMERPYAKVYTSPSFEACVRQYMARPKKSTIVLSVALALGVALPVQAQRSGDGYLFHSPEIRLSLRGGYDRASANSDIFDDATTNLTLKKRDFSALMVGGEVAFAAASRIDLSLDVGYSRAKSGSEFRKYIDNNNLP